MVGRKDYLDLSGKVAGMTGSGSGIGLGAAQMLWAHGAAAAMVEVPSKTEESARELRRKSC